MATVIHVHWRTIDKLAYMMLTYNTEINGNVA